MENDEDVAVNETVKIELWPDEGDRKALRQVGYGITPFILIEPDYDDETNTLSWSVVGSCVDDLDELVEMLDAGATVVREAIAQHAEASESDA